MEQASLQTINDGIMTKDLVGLVEPDFSAKGVTSKVFIREIRTRLEKLPSLRGFSRQLAYNPAVLHHDKTGK